jgi:hypothetical protein
MTTFTRDAIPFNVQASAGSSTPDVKVSTTGGLEVATTLTQAGPMFTTGQLTAQASVSFISVPGKIGFQTTIFASANVSAGFWIEIYTSGGTKLYIPARAAVP